jgi:tetratricopeptide (TPR) repeat protein
MVFLLALLIPLGPVDVVPSVFPGDREFVAREYVSAIAAYRAHLETHGDTAGVFWRLARVEVCMGDVTEDAESEAHYRKAELLARDAVRLDSVNADAHTWLAVALGSIAVFEGSKSKVRMAHEIKNHLDRAISLNPGDDVAYSVLGSFYAALGNISWLERQLAKLFIGRLPDGGYEEAEVAFRRAIALAPTVIRHHFALGLLFKDQDRDVEARVEFDVALSLPVVLARDIKDQRAARRLSLSLQ